MNWFGEPWPSAEMRAPVCHDDNARIDPPPPGEECVLCGWEIKEGDRGIRMPHVGPDRQFSYRYSHIECMHSNVTGTQWPHD